VDSNNPASSDSAGLKPETSSGIRSTCPDYLLLWLTGILVTELSSASGTGLLDMSTRTWSTAAIELCGVDADRLPRNLGSGAVSPGIAGLSLGTSGAVRMAVDEPQVDAGWTLFCYALTDSAWVVGGAISNGGVVLRWTGQSLAPDVQRTVGHERADAALLKLAASVPAGSDGLVMLPYLLAERAPLWDPDLPGAYLGLRLEHPRAHLIRAAVEGVCLQMRIILDRLDDVESVSSVWVTGGVFRSALWRDVMAAMLARPIHVVGAAEGTALGAAALGLFARDRAPTPTDAVTELSEAGAPPPETVEPDRQLMDTYDQLRASVPELIGALDGVAGLFARASGPEAGGAITVTLDPSGRPSTGA